jgi:sporulation protein YlmC with PRC-barrel domain
MATTQTNISSNRDVPRDETRSLIASDKVEGTSVYGTDGEKIGSIENVMIKKRSGEVAYAVLSFGGFLGVGSDKYPLPWSMLTYNENLGGYEVSITKDQLKRAPTYNDYDTNWASVDEFYRRRTQM